MPNRCGLCRQLGHNRTRCPHDAATQVSLREARRREQIEENRRAHEAFLRFDAARSTGHPIPLVPVTPSSLDPELGIQVQRAKPTCREIKVQEILFDRCQEIPEGIYKQLMDALVIQ